VGQESAQQGPWDLQQVSIWDHHQASTQAYRQTAILQAQLLAERPAHLLPQEMKADLPFLEQPVAVAAGAGAQLLLISTAALVEVPETLQGAQEALPEAL
jgi:hypothetical protein